MESGLISKYGPPSFKTDKPVYLREWNFSNLKIHVTSALDYYPKMEQTEEKDDFVFSDSFIIEYSNPETIDTKGL